MKTSIAQAAFIAAVTAAELSVPDQKHGVIQIVNAIEIATEEGVEKGKKVKKSETNPNLVEGYNWGPDEAHLFDAGWTKEAAAEYKEGKFPVLLGDNIVQISAEEIPMNLQLPELEMADVIVHSDEEWGL